MTEKPLADRVVDKMFDSDWFSQWLGIERVLVAPGECILRMTVRKEMLNGFQILHGGITFSLADSALAFASNSFGRMSVSIEASMSYIESAREGDILTATAQKLSSSNKIGIYSIEVTNQEGRLISHFKGTVYRTSKEWFPETNNS
jgi:acyl-CoA thioesterase